MMHACPVETKRPPLLHPATNLSHRYELTGTRTCDLALEELIVGWQLPLKIALGIFFSQGGAEAGPAWYFP